MIQKMEEMTLLILGTLKNYYSIELCKGKKPWEASSECSMDVPKFYCFRLYFFFVFVVFQGKL